LLCWAAGFADDYALLIAGLLDLYESGGGLQWLQWAEELQDTLDTTFWDPTGKYLELRGNGDRAHSTPNCQGSGFQLWSVAWVFAYNSLYIGVRR
jgi:uncharacterized protein YyaL (SSP411 family)